MDIDDIANWSSYLSNKHQDLLSLKSIDWEVLSRGYQALHFQFTQKHSKVFSRVDFYTLFAVRNKLIRTVSTFFSASTDLRRPKSKPCKFSCRPVSHQQKLTFGLLLKHQSFLWHFHQLHLTGISETAPDIATVLLKPLIEPTIDFFRINNQTASVGYRGPKAFRTACHIPNFWNRYLLFGMGLLERDFGLPEWPKDLGIV